MVEVVPPPLLKADTLERARDMMPGADVHALEAEWRGYWVSTGRPKLRSPDRAFLGFVAGKAGRGAG